MFGLDEAREGVLWRAHRWLWRAHTDDHVEQGRRSALCSEFNEGIDEPLNGGHEVGIILSSLAQLFQADIYILTAGMHTSRPQRGKRSTPWDPSSWLYEQRAILG